MSKVTVAGIEFDNLSMQETLVLINQRIIQRRKTVMTPVNVDCVVKAHEDEWYRKFIEKSDYIIADGMPIVWASKRGKNPLKERVTGADLLVEACKVASKHKWKIFFYGSAEGVAEEARKRLQEKYHCEIVGVYSPPFRGLTDQELDQIAATVNAVDPDIMFVSLGAPKQEKFIEQNLHRFNCKVFIPCGAAVDFCAGVKKRAPRFIQQIGMEWCWRLLSEPKRLVKRYFVDDMKFFKIILQTRD
ncbi:WecB/TagA/CpsF family glycosyltransferase [Paenibacillus sp. GCM10027628]|uniref:WecB/TagA/CpsF family glycosyltransferase n=1 Tax=Paenibacillus sp. GCM10027628 TaxID=3273413 RepID=UPI00362E6D25